MLKQWKLFGTPCQIEEDCPAPIRTPTSLVKFPCIPLTRIDSGKRKKTDLIVGKCERIETFDDMLFRAGKCYKSLNKTLLDFVKSNTF